MNTLWPKKMNSGCGNDFKIGYLNVDIRVDRGIWISTLTRKEREDTPILDHDLMSPSGLPVEYFEEVIARMMMEHVHIDLIPTVLYTLNCCMVNGGILEIIVPDFEEIARKFIAVEDDTTMSEIEKLIYFREMNFHTCDPSVPLVKGRGHQSLWTPKYARWWLEGEGFVVKEIEKNYEPFSMRIIAVKDSPFSVATPIRKDYKK